MWRGAGPPLGASFPRLYGHNRMVHRGQQSWSGGLMWLRFRPQAGPMVMLRRAVGRRTCISGRRQPGSRPPLHHALRRLGRSTLSRTRARRRSRRLELLGENRMTRFEPGSRLPLHHARRPLGRSILSRTRDRRRSRRLEPLGEDRLTRLEPGSRPPLHHTWRPLGRSTLTGTCAGRRSSRLERLGKDRLSRFERAAVNYSFAPLTFPPKPHFFLALSPKRW